MDQEAKAGQPMAIQPMDPVGPLTQLTGILPMDQEVKAGQPMAIQPMDPVDQP